MKRICIYPNTATIYEFQKGQNPYIHLHKDIVQKKAIEQHKKLEKAFSNISCFAIEYNDETKGLSDIVFVANGGICLPRLPKPLVILPFMKYKQRKEELPYLEVIFEKMGLATVKFPGDQSCPFEGQAEIKWFCGGTKAIAGYGFRSTKKTFSVLDKLLKKIYKKHGLKSPEILALPLVSDHYYHLDVAMLEFDDTKCIVHKRAFSPESVQKMRNFLGAENVHVLDTPDSFCLNAVVDGRNLITHKLTDSLKKELESITGKHIKQVDTSEFEKSGGSVRCMTLDVF